LLVVAFLIPAAFWSIDPALAGAVITLNVSGTNGRPQTHTLQVGERAIKMDIGQGVSIYDMATETTRYYDNRTRTYYEVTPADAAVIQAGIQAMRAHLQQQLPNLPEAQRRQVEALLRQQDAGAGNAASVTYRKLGRSEQVGSWRCEVYERLTNGAKNAELCLATTRAVGLTAADLKAIGSMARAMSRMTGPGNGAGQGAQAFDPDALSQAVGFSAFPVHTVIFLGGQPSMTTTVAAVERRDLPASAFAGPPGYTRQTLGGMVGGGTPIR
jgi:hypothetical protein